MDQESPKQGLCGNDCDDGGQGHDQAEEVEVTARPDDGGESDNPACFLRRRHAPMNAGSDRAWNSQCDIAPLPSWMPLADHENTRLVLEETPDCVAA
jgi:hypothetical protein